MRSVWLLVIASAGLGCAELDLGARQQGLAHEGPWAIPLDTLAIGDEQYVEYTGAGPWLGEESCSGGIEPGATVVSDYVEAWFPQVSYIGGYSCRPINGDGSTASVHATGRALDIFIPLAAGDQADNDLGDPLANWFIENAEHIGIQYVIWDRWTWGAYADPGEKDGYYSGAHPHHDHLHVELSVEAAAQGTPFFGGEQGPPVLPACPTVPADGAVIDDPERCVQFFGPGDYWRVEEGAGFGGRLVWTNAYEGTDPSNWARWRFAVEEPGDYLLEVYVDPAFGRFPDAVYEIVHAGGVDQVTLDQSSAEGWVALASVSFAAEEYEVRVLDVSSGPVGDAPHIAVDALRVTRTAGGEGDFAGGCQTGGAAPPASGLWLLAALGLARRRRAAGRRTPG